MVYTCDWPGDSGDGTCGKPARWFVDGGTYHRPVCGGHNRSGDQLIENIDPKKVPGWKPPVVPERKVPRMEHPITITELTAEVPPGSDKVTASPSRPPLREALEDVAVELCLALKRKLEKL